MRTKLQTTAKLALAILVAVSWISTANVQAQLGAPQAAVNSKALAERLGPDDGYAVTISFSGDTHGSLETCG